MYSRGIAGHWASGFVPLPCHDESDLGVRFSEIRRQSSKVMSSPPGLLWFRAYVLDKKTSWVCPCTLFRVLIKTFILL